MKTMTCKQLGGACEQKFSANTFEELVQKVQIHGQEMYQKADSDHMAVMQEVAARMQNPEEMKKWMDSVRAEFDNLPED